MSLRFKLLLIALSMLVLPVAGWLIVRQMEELLRQGQEQTLIASAQALARSLDALKAELPPTGSVLYVHDLTHSIAIDGYADDWENLIAHAQNLGPPDDAQKLKLLIGSNSDWLYLFAIVRDTTRNRADAADAYVQTHDHLTLTLERAGITRNYLLASAAPGTFAATSHDDIRDATLPQTLRGAWQEDGSGYRVELRLPRSQMPDRLALTMYDSAAPVAELAESRPLLSRSASLSTELAQFAPEGMRVRLLSGEGWVVAETGKLSGAASSQSSRRRWLETLIYRSLIAPGLTRAQDFAPDLPRLSAAEVWQALSGVAATAWHPAASEEQVVLAAAVPLKVGGEVRGALLLEQAGDALPLLTNRALLILVGASLAALLLAGAVIFAFASVLGLRIRRLRDAADRAMRKSGKMDTSELPLIDAKDELGDLARSFAHLLDEVATYTDYLRTLASKLSHELQTPLAIVKSSLDNLDHQAVPAAARTYLARARDGADRLGAIVRAMSEASRLERAIHGVEGEDFDLAAVVRGCAEAYRPLAAPRRLETEIPASTMIMHGAPELIAQALDKLFDNARGFTPDDGWIRIALQLVPEGALITLANQGPPLPPTLQERLFDSLVSVRPSASPRVDDGGRSVSEAPHLGLGLYVVRLIAELHRGQAQARNLSDGNGVEFSLLLRGMPRRPLATNV
jgi:two-component system, OmpR family, sensor histidine kinase ChvG